MSIQTSAAGMRVRAARSNLFRIALLFHDALICQKNPENITFCFLKICTRPPMASKAATAPMAATTSRPTAKKAATAIELQKQHH